MDSTITENEAPSTAGMTSMADLLAGVSDDSFVSALASAKVGDEVDFGNLQDGEPPTEEDAADPSFGSAQNLLQTDEAPTPEPTPEPTQEQPKGKPEPVNFANLRKAREAAEKERDSLREERDALLSKANEADLTRAEKEKLAQDLDQARRELEEKSLAVERINARETPEYKSTMNLYQTGWKKLNEIVASEALRDAGLVINPQLLLQNDKDAINQTMRALHESGNYAETQELASTLQAMNVWRVDLQSIEQKALEKAEQWRNNRDSQFAQTLEKAQEELSRDVPYMNFKSAAFISLPDDQKEVIRSVHNEASTGVKRVLDSVNNPEVLTSMAYRSAVVLQAQAMELTQLKQALPAREAEIAKLQKELSAYKRAAGESLPNGNVAPTVKNDRNRTREDEFQELMGALKSMQ